MGKIVLLDELTINKIAAGEVVERPASVVKEMVENSIDAGATNIEIEIKNGGISYIRVSDNGKGIEKDDMEIAFERHATSKIRQADDLETVKSMGFRGEALASIAAIANVEMVSKTAEADFGYKLIVEAGQVLEKGEIGCSKGTSMTVRNLFFNTPVRYKFLKKDYTESGYIEDIVTRLCLVHPHIAFKLISSGKTVIQTSGDGEQKNCIYSIFGKDITNGIIQVHYVYDDIVIEGVIGKPEIARNNRSQQMFFINNRYVKDKTLSSSVEQAYKGLLTIGKHAFCVLNIQMNPSQVDVNVHPAKLEVRFKDENKVFKAIYNTIKENLLKSDLVKHAEKLEDIETEEIEKNDFKYMYEKTFGKEIIKENKEEYKPIIQEEPVLKIEPMTEIQFIQEPEKKEEKQEIENIENIEKIEEPIQFMEEPVDYVKEENIQQNVFENKDLYIEQPKYKFIGIAFSTYIILEMDKNMYIIDQHAAHERIMYERIKKNYYSSEQKDSQIMLLPDIITLTHKEMEIVRENINMFEKSGFSLEEFGDNTIKLIGVPNICIDLDTKELFIEILDAIGTVAVTTIQEKEDKFIATVACKAAVKANMALDKQDVEYLMEDLLKLPNPFTCPHGRPTAIQMSKLDIEKKFSRR